ncbi:MAG: cytochrome c oxidase assembly protein, partial [Actinomycetota bacterium]|nr:cytochrome c oxidase assembly protein [Actinomycetota bacterium]
MTAVLAHGGALVGPHDLAGAWSLDPLVLLAVLVAGWWYAAGVGSLWRSAGRGQVITRAQVVAFLGGVGAVLVALVSPLDALGGALFSAHMSQHLLLTLLAAPLLALGAPLQAMGWGLPGPLRRRANRLQGRLRRALRNPALPALGLALYTLVFTLWHVPVLYDAALRMESVHVAEHVTMLGTALAFWWPIVRPRRTHAGAGVLLLFASLVATGVLAALLIFAPRAWYAYPATEAWGLSPLQDQQLGGAVMWVPGGIVYVVAGAAVLLRWLRLDAEQATRAQRRT